MNDKTEYLSLSAASQKLHIKQMVLREQIEAGNIPASEGCISSDTITQIEDQQRTYIGFKAFCKKIHKRD